MKRGPVNVVVGQDQDQDQDQESGGVVVLKSSLTSAAQKPTLSLTQSVKQKIPPFLKEKRNYAKIGLVGFACATNLLFTGTLIANIAVTGGSAVIGYFLDDSDVTEQDRFLGVLQEALERPKTSSLKNKLPTHLTVLMSSVCVAVIITANFYHPFSQLLTSSIANISITTSATAASTLGRAYNIHALEKQVGVLKLSLKDDPDLDTKKTLQAIHARLDKIQQTLAAAGEAFDKIDDFESKVLNELRECGAILMDRHLSEVSKNIKELEKKNEDLQKNIQASELEQSKIPETIAQDEKQLTELNVALAAIDAQHLRINAQISEKTLQEVMPVFPNNDTVLTDGKQLNGSIGKSKEGFPMPVFPNNDTVPTDAKPLEGSKEKLKADLLEVSREREEIAAKVKSLKEKIELTSLTAQDSRQQSQRMWENYQDNMIKLAELLAERNGIAQAAEVFRTHIQNSIQEIKDAIAAQKLAQVPNTIIEFKDGDGSETPRSPDSYVEMSDEVSTSSPSTNSTSSNVGRRDNMFRDASFSGSPTDAGGGTPRPLDVIVTFS